MSQKLVHFRNVCELGDLVVAFLQNTEFLLGYVVTNVHEYFVHQSNHLIEVSWA